MKNPEVRTDFWVGVSVLLAVIVIAFVLYFGTSTLADL